MSDLYNNLQEIKKIHGEAAYQRVLRYLVYSLLSEKNGEDYLRRNFPELDLEALRREVQETPANLIRHHVPSIQTQMEFDLFMAAFTALKTLVDGYLSGNETKIDKGKGALDSTLGVISQLRSAREKASEIPEDQRGQKTQEFMASPKEFLEIEEQRRLLAELDAISDSDGLKSWYQACRERMDKVVTPKYRNELFDAIRAKLTLLDN